MKQNLESNFLKYFFNMAFPSHYQMKNSLPFQHIFVSDTCTVADLRGREGLNSFNFMQFLEKFGRKSYVGTPVGGLAPPPQGNPGSATDVYMRIAFTY